jgi:hypothetical protein
MPKMHPNDLDLVEGLEEYLAVCGPPDLYGFDCEGADQDSEEDEDPPSDEEDDACDYDEFDDD